MTVEDTTTTTNVTTTSTTTTPIDDDVIPLPPPEVESPKAETDAVLVAVPLGDDATPPPQPTTTKTVGQPSSSTSSRPPTFDTCIMVTAGIYTLFAALLFLWPFYIGHNSSGDGWDDLARVIGAILLCGVAMIILTIVSICVGSCRWSRISTAMKVVTFYPLTMDILIFLVMFTLGKISSRETNYDEGPYVVDPYTNMTLIPKDDPNF